MLGVHIASRFVRGSTRTPMGDFTKLAVWQKAHAVTIAIYHETAQWPKHELFGLVSQSRRAAVSISANIAEGCGKNSDAELARHSRTSLGSANELSYYVTLSHDLEYLTDQTCDDLQASISEVRRMLASLERISAAAAERAAPSLKLRRKPPPPTDAVPADG